jgi:hypothetical protein
VHQMCARALHLAQPHQLQPHGPTRMPSSVTQGPLPTARHAQQR